MLMVRLCSLCKVGMSGFVRGLELFLAISTLFLLLSEEGDYSGIMYFLKILYDEFMRCIMR